jgi:polyhydroxyalkanoate synthesis repressor PhaR
VAEAKKAQQSDPITIKKYANRRLYNTATSSYVTLEHLCQMVKEGVDFAVYDAKSSEDITRTVLTQIIVEEEAKGENLLPITFLRQLISLYGDNMQWIVPRYLDHMMSAFSTNQDRMRQAMQETFGGMFPFSSLEEVSKQNMVLFENAMKAFSPFPAETQGEANEDGAPPKTGNANSEALQKLKAQMDALQHQLETLTAGEPPRGPDKPD